MGMALLTYSLLIILIVTKRVHLLTFYSVSQDYKTKLESCLVNEIFWKRVTGLYSLLFVPLGSYLLWSLGQQRRTNNELKHARYNSRTRLGEINVLSQDKFR